MLSVVVLWNDNDRNNLFIMHSQWFVIGQRTAQQVLFHFFHIRRAMLEQDDTRSMRAKMIIFLRNLIQSSTCMSVVWTCSIVSPPKDEEAC